MLPDSRVLIEKASVLLLLIQILLKNPETQIRRIAGPYFLMLWSSSVEMVAITHKLHLSLKASDFGPLILLQNDGKLA